MPTAPSTSNILRKPAEHIRNQILPTLQALYDGLSDIGEMNEECQKAKASLDVTKRNLAGMQGELKDATDQYNAMAKKAHEAHTEWERLNAEIKTKSAELSSVTGQLNKIRQQLGG